MPSVIRKAMKSHKCSCCGRVVPKGAHYQAHAGRASCMTCKPTYGTWGGAREGGGRKPLGEGQSQQYTVKVSEQDAQRLEALRNEKEPTSKLVRRALLTGLAMLESEGGP